MPRYLITRTLGEASDEEIEAAADASRDAREAGFPDITWEHSHVVRTAEGLRTYCVYDAPTPERVREHAAAAGLPVDDVLVIERDILG